MSHLYEFSNWFRDWKINYSSNSNSKKIIEFYEEILKGEYSDVDYWYSYGIEYVNSILLKFDDNDWNSLIIDIPNWKKTQIGILTLILTHDESIEKKLLYKKSEVYIYLLTICDDENFINAIEYLNFISSNEKPNVEFIEIIKNRLINLKRILLNNDFCNTYNLEIFEMFLNIVNEIINKSKKD